MSFAALRVTFDNDNGQRLAARLDLPLGHIRGYALFAHCFTCSKDLAAARHIAAELARLGVGVLRFDFTGLGSSEGEFANTGFSTNVDDVVAAADYLRREHAAPAILIGHSLGGAAVLAAADRIPEAKGVVTIGAPSDVAHVLAHLGGRVDDIRREGAGEVSLAGRRFTIARSFVEDAGEHRLAEHIARMRKALLVMHAPLDDIVGIDHAQAIFVAARHPKSFVSLDRADHLLTNPADAAYAARVISAWASHFIVEEPPAKGDGHEHVVVSEIGQGAYQNSVVAGRHRLFADEPTAVGGDDLGPSPYDFLSMALGACKSMTLRMYARRKGLDLGRISVDVRHGKVPVDHCEDCGHAAEGRTGKIDRFECRISVDGDVTPEIAERLVEIAGKCPVHRTLEAASAIVTRLAEPTDERA